jgi:hypothetical protein
MQQGQLALNLIRQPGVHLPRRFVLPNISQAGGCLGDGTVAKEEGTGWREVASGK